MKMEYSVTIAMVMDVMSAKEQDISVFRSSLSSNNNPQDGKEVKYSMQ